MAQYSALEEFNPVTAVLLVCSNYVKTVSVVSELLKAAMNKWSKINIFSPVAGIAHEKNWEYCVTVNLVSASSMRFVKL